MSEPRYVTEWYERAKKAGAELADLKAKYEKAVECINWYAKWDWSDKYVQAVPKKAIQTLAELGEKE